MANNFNIEYDQDLPSTADIDAAEADSHWYVHGLQVQISLRGPSAFTPTHFKMWGIDGVTTSGSASWQPMQATVTGTLENTSEAQYVYVQYKNGAQYSDVVTTSGIYYTFTDPSVDDSMQWKTALSDLGNESADVATLRNESSDIEIEFSKDNVTQLRFHELDLSGLSVGSNYISATADSQIEKLLDLDTNSYVTVTKVFSTDAPPMIRVDTGDGNFVTITTYDGSVRTDVTGDYAGRVDNINFNSGTKTLTFDLYKFSTYGFCTVEKVEFALDSQDRGYVGQALSVKAEVKDTNGDLVENAPVTISGISGDSIGNFTSTVVNTDVNGIATFTLNLTSEGTAVYDVYVDDIHSVTDQTTVSLAMPGNFSRSLLTQLEQIRRSETYDDLVVDANTSAIAEPTTTTGTQIRLQHDLNVFRTLIRQIKGETNWFDDLGTYFDPANTSSGDITTKHMTLENIKGNTLDSKTILLATDEDNSGAGYTVSGTDAGLLFTTGLSYAVWSDRRGLPIFSSVANAGTYSDEGGSDDVCVIDLIDSDTGGEFQDGSGNIIYAKFHDGADYGGVGNGTDAYVKFYSNNTPYTFTASDPTNIMFVFPYRKVLSEMEEYEWLRTDFVSSFEGDDELLEDISNLWSFTGSTDGDSSPQPWTNTGGNYIFNSDPSDLQSAMDEVNTEIGDRTYTGNYITSDDPIADSLEDLDVKLKEIEDSLDATSAAKYVLELSSDVSAGNETFLPTGVTYTPDDTSGQEGSNMDVFVNGQLVSASTGVGGVNEDKDYAETSISGVTFHMDLYQYTNITYMVRQ